MIAKIITDNKDYDCIINNKQEWRRLLNEMNDWSHVMCTTDDEKIFIRKDTIKEIRVISKEIERLADYVQ